MEPRFHAFPWLGALRLLMNVLTFLSVKHRYSWAVSFTALELRFTSAAYGTLYSLNKARTYNNPVNSRKLYH